VYARGVHRSCFAGPLCDEALPDCSSPALSWQPYCVLAAHVLGPGGVLLGIVHGPLLVCQQLHHGLRLLGVAVVVLVQAVADGPVALPMADVEGLAAAIVPVTCEHRTR
jgi:hypothetical protein